MNIDQLDKDIKNGLWNIIDGITNFTMWIVVLCKFMLCAGIVVYLFYGMLTGF